MFCPVGYFVVCTSSICVLWLPLWYLQTLCLVELLFCKYSYNHIFCNEWISMVKISDKYCNWTSDVMIYVHVHFSTSNSIVRIEMRTNWDFSEWLVILVMPWISINSLTSKKTHQSANLLLVSSTKIVYTQV